MKKVLVIDDAMTVRMYHRHVLEQAGFEVDEAENGVEALEKALNSPADLYVVDINMPQMDGYRFLEIMRSENDLADAPVIMVSTEAEAHDREKALKAGANYYLIKPTPSEQLQDLARVMTGVN